MTESMTSRLGYRFQDCDSARCARKYVLKKALALQHYFLTFLTLCPSHVLLDFRTEHSNCATIIMPPKDKYSDPKLRDQVKEEIHNSDKGGAPGQWSARKV